MTTHPIGKCPATLTECTEGCGLGRVCNRLADPIDMVLFCTCCGTQHIDGTAPGQGAMHYDELPGGMNEWTNPPHRSHLCHSCGHVWRPADVPTNGVRAVKTKGKNDSALRVPPITDPY